MAPVKITCAMDIVMNIVFLVATLLSVSNIDFVTASTNTTWSNVDCNETPPNCSATFTYSFGVDLDYTTSDNMNLNVLLLDYEVGALYTVCSFDPLGHLPGLHDVLIDNNTLVTIQITCQTRGTRLVIISKQTNIISRAMVWLQTENCNIYWKDISRIGGNVNLNGLILNSWKDEFASDNSRFFAKCVQLRNSTTTGTTGSKLIMSGMNHMNLLMLTNDDVLPISPVFTHYFWPTVAEFICRR